MANLCLLKLSYGTVIFPIVLTGGAGWTMYSGAPESRGMLTVPALGAEANFSVHGNQHAKGELAGKPRLVNATPSYGPTSRLPDARAVALAPASEKVDKGPVGRSMPRADRAIRDGVEIVRLVLPEATPLQPDDAAAGLAQGDRIAAVSIDSSQLAQLARPADLREEPVTTASASAMPGSLEGAVAKAGLVAPGQQGGAAGASLAGLTATSPIAGDSSRDPVPGVAPIDFDLSRQAADRTGLAREVSAHPSGLMPAARTTNPGRSQPVVKPGGEAPSRLATRALPRKQALGGRTYSVSQDTISFTMPLEVNGRVVGSLPLQISDSNMISVKLADLLEVVRTDPGAAGLAALANTAAAQEYVSFDQIRAAGIPIRYDAAHDRIII